MSELCRSMVDDEVLLGRSVKKWGLFLTPLNNEMLKSKSFNFGDLCKIPLR